MKASGVTVRTQAHVTGIERQEGRVRPGWRGFKIQLADSEPIYVDRVVLCTGENPDLDEDDGRVWAEQFGHTIVPPKSAIVALHTEEDCTGYGQCCEGLRCRQGSGKEVTR